MGCGASSPASSGPKPSAENAKRVSATSSYTAEKLEMQLSAEWAMSQLEDSCGRKDGAFARLQHASQIAHEHNHIVAEATFRLLETALMRGFRDPDTILARAESARALLATAPNSLEASFARVHMCATLAQALFDAGRTEAAWALLQEGQSLVNELAASDLPEPKLTLGEGPKEAKKGQAPYPYLKDVSELIAEIAAGCYMVQVRQGDLNAALSSMEKCMAHTPGGNLAQLNECGLLLMRMGKHEAAIIKFQALYGQGRNFAEAYGQHGEKVFQGKQTDPSMALERHQHTLAGLLGLAICNKSLGRLPEAKHCIQMGLGLLLVGQGPRPPQHLGQIMACLFGERGNVCMLIGDFQEGYESFEIMLGMSTALQDLHAMERAELGMARSLAALGKQEEAFAHLDAQRSLAEKMENQLASKEGDFVRQQIAAGMVPPVPADKKQTYNDLKMINCTDSAYMAVRLGMFMRQQHNDEIAAKAAKGPKGQNDKDENEQN